VRSVRDVRRRLPEGRHPLLVQRGHGPALAWDGIIHIRNFRMDFDGTTVVRDLSFDIDRGETFGFLGSNGSGKTTTIRALLGIYQPTAGNDTG
jgi:ABC-type bacteriocin/lantibiotic exporter with double-glycine peptidase domain